MIKIDGNKLTIEEIAAVVYQGVLVEATAESIERIRANREVIDKIVDEEKVVYGINTGFGKLSEVSIPKAHVEQLQYNLLRSHACGTGEPFPEEVSRAMLLLRANALLKGYSGVRPVLIEKLLELLNAHIHPIIPEQGSLGASGDLAPLAHLALVVIGEGMVSYHGQQMEAAQALEKASITPLTLSAKEGLALINGTQAMAAQGVIAYLEAEKLARQSELVASLTMESLRGIRDAFAEEIQMARGYPEQLQVAQRMNQYLQGSRLITQQGELRVQDAYSIRCIPQVHGATWQVLNYVRQILTIEINAATDNPLVFEEKVLSGGNFHGQPLALAMDFMKIGVAELANISERRTERMVNPQLSGLPAFLSHEPGIHSGTMILQYVAASLVSENKVLAHPASVDSIPSSANQEDHVSMGTIAARQVYAIIQNLRKVLAIELINALQAVEFRQTEDLSPRTRKLYDEGRRRVKTITQDRVLSTDIEIMAEWLKNGDWSTLLLPQA